MEGGRDGYTKEDGIQTKRIIFPPDAADLDVSQDSGTESFALELLKLLICLCGGFPGGPFPRLCFLGCRSANCSDLLFFFVSGLRVPDSSWWSVAFSPEVLCWAEFSEPSSDRGVSALSSLLVSTDCCGVDIFWQHVRMK